MKIAAQNHQSYTRSKGRSNSPDEVSDEFSSRRRHREPGPDDVYDPDQCGRGGSSDYGSAHYYDTDSSGGGSWVLF